MKKIIIQLSFIFLVATSVAQPYNWQWAVCSNSLGGTPLNQGPTIGYGVATDGHGNVYATGSCSANTVFGNLLVQTGSMFLAKYDAMGNIIWLRSSDDFAEAYDIYIDALDNIYITGTFENAVSFGGVTFSSTGYDMFLLKYDTEGNVIWGKQSNGNMTEYDHFGLEISGDNTGNIYVTGRIPGVVSFSGNTTGTTGVYSGFFIKYDANGNLLLLEDFSATQYGIAAAGISIDSAGYIYITGSFRQTVTFDNITLNTVSNDVNDGDIFIVKYDPFGTAVWAKQAGCIYDEEWGFDIILDGYGSFYITGQCGANGAIFDNNTVMGVGNFNTMFWAKYDTTGSLTWVATPNSSDESRANKIVFDESGDLYISIGNNWNSLTFGNYTTQKPINILKSDTNGNVLWVKSVSSGHLGGYCCEEPYDIGYDNGNIYLTGAYQDSAHFDNIGVYGQGFYSFFLAKLPVECSAFFTLTPDSVPYHYTAINQVNGQQPVTYSWDWGDGNIDNSPYPSHTYADTGTYTICLSITDGSGCTDTYCTDHTFKTEAQMVYVNVISTGINDDDSISESTELLVYPNPANTSITVEINSTSATQKSQLRIINSIGQIVYLSSVNGSRISADISALSPGIYFLNVNDGEKEIRGKFIKEN